MDFQPGRILLLDQAIQTHARGEHLAGSHINISRRRDAFFDQIIGFMQDDVLQAVYQETNDGLVERNGFLSSFLHGRGYGIDNIPQVFTIASATSIQFAADLDDGSPAAPCDAAFENATNGGAERITYSVVDTALTRAVECWNGSSWTAEVGSQALIWNLVAGQTVFTYFDEDGTPLTGTLTSAQRDAIRSVAIRIDLEDDSYNHIGAREHTAYELSSQVEIHNLQ